MDESRRQFEEWFAELSGQTIDWVRKQRASDTHYQVGPEIQRYWMTWQASRAAIEITPPGFIDSRSALDKGYTVDYSNGFGDAMDAYENNISAIGLKIKEG